MGKPAGDDIHPDVYAELAVWSQQASLCDADEAQRLDGASAWRQTLELASLARRLSPPETPAQQRQLARDRQRYALRLQAFERWRTRAG